MIRPDTFQEVASDGTSGAFEIPAVRTPERLSQRARRALQEGDQEEADAPRQEALEPEILPASHSSLSIPVMPEHVPPPTDLKDWVSVEQTPDAEEDGGERVKEAGEIATPSDPEVARLKRDLVLGEDLEKIERGERLSEVEKRRVIGALESRGWQNMLGTVQEGDALAAFLVPGGDSFGIKHLNDDLFGMQKTDEIIAFRRTCLERHMRDANLNRVAYSFKDEYFRIPKDVDRSATSERLHVVAETVRKEMTIKLAMAAIVEYRGADQKRQGALDAFLASMLGEKAAGECREARSRLSALEEAVGRYANEEVEARVAISRGTGTAGDHAGAKARLESAIRLQSSEEQKVAKEVIAPALSDPMRGYRVTFGTSEVGAPKKEGDFSHIETAVSSAIKGAMVARHHPEHGHAFVPEDMDRIMIECRKLRASIGTSDLVDRSGRVYPIFTKQADGTVKLSLDLIRDIRKGRIEPKEDQRELFDYVASYIASLNILDIVKPYTHEELSGGTVYGTGRSVSEIIRTTSEMVESVKNGSISEDQSREIGVLLQTEGKDRLCTSAVEFNRSALRIPDCTYLSLDVLDVGPELIQEFERLIQLIEVGKISLEQAQMIAGDATTRKMRDFRKSVTDTYRELTGEDRPLMYVGGDEVVLAMDSADVTDEFVLALRKIRLGPEKDGSVRVVKTVVGSGERHSDLRDADRTMKEHLRAKKIAERGTTVAKELERGVHDIERLINELPRRERAIHQSALSDLNLLHFAVRQTGERDVESSVPDFDLIVQDPFAPEKTIHASLDGVRKGIEDLRNRLSGEVLKYRERIVEMYRSRYPGVTMENASLIIRRLDLASGDEHHPDFEKFIIHFA